MRDALGVICLILGGAAAVALVVGLLRPRTFARRGTGAAGESAAVGEGAAVCEGAAAGEGAGAPPRGPRPRTVALALAPLTAGFLLLGWVLLVAPTYSVTIDPGEQVVAAPGSTLLAVVDNDGLLDGTYEATLVLDGDELEDVAVAAPAGETATTELAMPDDLTAGPHTLELGDETLEFTALTPPEYKVARLLVDPDVQKVGATVRVSTTVSNTGEATGTFPGVLKVNGEEAATSEVVVEGNGGASSVQFEFERPRPGVCRLDVSGSKGKAVIVKPVRLANGAVLVNSLGGGVGKLVLDNRYQDDCMVSLTTSKSAKKPSLCVYVRGRDKTTVSGLRDGEYWAFFSVGDDWNRYTTDFLDSSERSRFTKPVPFMTKRWTTSYTDWSAWTRYTTAHTEYTLFTLTFGSNKGTDPGVSVTEDGFPAPK
jgi:hypothetical protein